MHAPIKVRPPVSILAGSGVLLTNLGTPDAPTEAALRAYLAEFLSDPKVVTLPRLVWWPILHGRVLRRRPAESAKAYARIWKSTGSPLLLHTRAIAAALQSELEMRADTRVPLAVGMRYGSPSLAEALVELAAAGATHPLVLPLYPQYARATVGSSVTALRKLAPQLQFIEGYHDDPGYLAALAASVREHWARHGRGAKLLMSFHGIPQRAARRDPYGQQCRQTAENLAAALHLHDDEWQLTFQSRFGRAAWLQPYTEETLKQLAAQGARTVDVICPGFAADCLETLEEIALRYAESFRRAGGKELRYIPALNARADHVHALAELLLAKLRPSDTMA